jgi:hypothetical protein
MMRDVYELDLMPFYNCYANETITDVDFNSDAEVKLLSTKQAADIPYKFLSLPVKFGKKYMIAIDNEFPTEVMCVIYGKKGLVYELTSNLNDSTLAVGKENLAGTTYKKF